MNNFLIPGLRKALGTPTVTLQQAVMPVLLTLSLLLYMLLPGTAGVRHRELQTEVLRLRTQALELERQAVELQSLASRASSVPSAESLLLQVRSAAAGAGFGQTLLRSDADGSERVTISTDAVDFNLWLSWLEGLQVLNIRLESARITATDVPGMVSLTATLLGPAVP
jgi:type II secretory pathway component PulM